MSPPALPSDRDLIQRALQLARQGRPEQAESVLQDVLRRNSDSLDARALLGALAFRQHRYEEAVAAYGICAGARPRNGSFRFNLGIAVAKVASDEDFPDAFALIRDMRPDALLVMDDPMIGRHRTEVIAFAASTRLPACYGQANIVREGGLVSYGPLIEEHYVMAARYVDRILKGAKPADLPVEQPTRFEFIINLKTAKALGITIPQALAVRADEKI